MPLNPDDLGSRIPAALLLGTDLALGAATRATRLALRTGETGWGASVAVGRLVASLPGADGAGRLLGTAARPLADEGRGMRARAASAVQDGTGRLLEAVLPGIVDALDIDGLARRIDVDRLIRRIEVDDLLQRIDIDRLVSRIDIDALVSRIEIDALVQRIDIDRLVSRVDVDAIVDRIDVNRVVQRVDIDAVVEETELGTIVARSTSGFASEALDAARSQTAGVDTLLNRAVNRVLRRREGEVPVGPPLLTGEPNTDPTASPLGTEPPTQDAAERDDG